MKNNTFFITILLVFAVFLFFACLDQVNFDPDSVYNANVTGDINTTDVTSAVLMLTNRSKTVDVTKVSIAQPEWEPPERNPWAQAPGVSFANRPKRLERKAQYLSPSDKSYQITIDYAYDASEDSPAGDGTKTMTIPLPLPRQIVELFIYRDKDGVTIIDKDVNDPDPDDTGNPAVDPSPGEGSSPAVIPPENRNRMATFVVINKTNSQIIDSAEFKMGDKGYAIGKIGIIDKQSIALGQGTWETTVAYTLNNKLTTLGPKNSVIVPSNDPQSVREHYLYFYKTKRGDYNISQEWPPYPADADEEDMLPPDFNGKGRGLIKIINNSYSIAKLVTILNLRESGLGPMILYYPEFSPPVPVQYSKTGYVNVVGTNDFPIDAHEDYLIQVTLEGNDSLATVERKAYIKDQVVTIIIAPDDLKETNAVGATVTLQNRVTSWPITVTSMIVRNKASAQSSVYGIHTWQPSGVICNNNSAEQFVISSAAMPILKGDLFEAVIIVQGNGKTDFIIKDFSPAELYSEKPPEQNTRTLTITDSDIPDGVKEIFVPVSLIKLGKESMNVVLQKGAVVSGGRLNLKNYTTVLPANATVQGPVTWELVDSGSVLFYEPTLLTNSGIIDIYGRNTPSTGPSSTTLGIKATIQNAAGNLFGRKDYTQNFSITVYFSELPPAPDPDVWADSISITGGNLTIKVGEYRNLSDLVVINPSNATVTNDDITWSIVGAGSEYFNLVAPIIIGKAVGTGTVRATLPASKNGGTEHHADLNVTVISNKEDIPDPDPDPDVWAESISVTGGDLTIKVGEYRILSDLVVINPPNATVTNDDIIWSIVGSGSAYFKLIGPYIVGKAVGTGVVRATLPASKNGGTERQADIYVTVIPDKEEIITPDPDPDIWADSINITGGNLTIKVGEYRNLSSLVKIIPSNATVTNDDINWTTVGSGSAYFNLNGPIITGKAVGTGIVRVVLPASKNGGTERHADLNVTVTPNNEEITDPDDGRILTPPQTGDSVNWVEIARNGDYSLIVRAHYINIYPSHKNDPSWNYTAFGWNNAYGNSIVRKKINEFFNGTSVVENLPDGARLRQFTVKNNAANILGTNNSKVGLTDGFSKPTDIRVQSGDDVAFALSYGEAANFCSKSYFIRDMSPSIQKSSDKASGNYDKIDIPPSYIYGMWLRSPGDLSNTAAAITNINDYGRVFQLQLDGDKNEHGLVYPAVWVHKDIFK